MQNPQAAGLIWYFSTTAAHAVALDGKHDKQVLAYLDCYLGTATRPGGAINDVHNLTNPQLIEWKLADSDDSVASIPAGRVMFYPHRFIQIAPQVYDVDLGGNTKAMYDDAWAYLNAGGDRWWEGTITDGSNDGAPFMFLAYGASVRGDRAKANSQLKFFQAGLARPQSPPKFGAVNELGWALRATMQVK